MKKQKQMAFTLLELIMVLLLIGILYSIVYPSYIKHLVRVRRICAITVLLNAAGKMEEAYVAHGFYSSTFLGNDCLNNDTFVKYYRLDVNANESTFLLQAIPVGKQIQQDNLCGILSINQNGELGVSGIGAVAECWR